MAAMFQLDESDSDYDDYSQVVRYASHARITRTHAGGGQAGGRAGRRAGRQHARTHARTYAPIRPRQHHPTQLLSQEPLELLAFGNVVQVARPGCPDSPSTPFVPPAPAPLVATRRPRPAGLPAAARRSQIKEGWCEQGGTAADGKFDGPL